MLVRTAQSGFTLVELAIVLTIIGLLIGGILKGQQLLLNARTTATIAQVKSIGAAVITFKDMYNAVPGDMNGAVNRLVGCTPGCSPFVGSPGAGDSMVGDPAWQTTWAAQGAVTAGNAATTSVGQETYLFWDHLMLANLIGQVTSQGVNKPTLYAWGVTHPAAKIGGGFVVGYADGSSSAPGNSGGNCGNGNNNGNNGNCRGVPSNGNGLILALLPTPTSTPATTTTGGQELSPLVAQIIDTKMDDGAPDNGIVEAFGAASCFGSGGNGNGNGNGNGGGGATVQYYDATITTTDCGLFFSIFN
jgi:prepilin-type N-terminal cleavage/methylation domain-containing protein